MAIKALEQELCDDCISRQAVLDYAKDTCLDLDSFDDTEVFCDEIKLLPSVSPQEPCSNCCNGNQIEKAKLCQKSYLAGMEHKPKTGQWIDDCGGAKCSCCGYCIDDYYYVKTYCPNCGAKMQEVEE